MSKFHIQTKFEFEQILKLNKFWFWTKFEFEQIWDMNNNFKYEQNSTMNKF
jgi:hypothetical protein